jgi:hypothetical protein
MKACISLQCAKVSILLYEKDRHWLVQLACAVLHKTQSRSMLLNQGDASNVYEGYKNNVIAQLAISNCECVTIHNVNSHAGYDSSLDALAGIVGRNCLAAPIIAGDLKANAHCVGVLFATNKSQGSFLGDVFRPVPKSYIASVDCYQALMLSSLEHLLIQQRALLQV